MKSIKDIKLENKKVILRADFNEPVENGTIIEEERIKAAKKTISFILENNPECLLIVSHLGRTDGKKDLSFSLKAVVEVLEKLIGQKVLLIDEVEEIPNALARSQGGPKVFLLENIRFWPEEESGNEDFAKKIAENFDVFVNDAFSASHRNHASITKIPLFVEQKCAGLLFEEEYNQLSKLLDPELPAVAVIGGAKIETKLPVIENLKNLYSNVLVGGLIANEALDKKIVFDKVMLPQDFAPAGKESQRLDIGPLSVNEFKNILDDAKTIVWNGPMGKFEQDDCAEGTKGILNAIASNKKARTIVGGGETLEAIGKFGNFSDFDYVSMSGGAMLEFLAGKELPGIEVLDN